MRQRVRHIADPESWSKITAALADGKRSAYRLRDVINDEYSVGDGITRAPEALDRIHGICEALSQNLATVSLKDETVGPCVQVEAVRSCFNDLKQACAHPHAPPIEQEFEVLISALSEFLDHYGRTVADDGTRRHYTKARLREYLRERMNKHGFPSRPGDEPPEASGHQVKLPTEEVASTETPETMDDGSPFYPPDAFRDWSIKADTLGKVARTGGIRRKEVGRSGAKKKRYHYSLPDIRKRWPHLAPPNAEDQLHQKKTH